MADLAGPARQTLEPARHHRRGRRGLADPRHLAQALPLPRLPRRDRDRQRARRRPVRLPPRRHRTPPLAPPLRRRAADRRAQRRAAGARPRSRRSRSSNGAASTRPAAGAIADVSPPRRAALDLRPDRPHLLALGALAAAARRRRLRPAGPDPRADAQRRAPLARLRGRAAQTSITSEGGVCPLMLNPSRLPS